MKTENQFGLNFKSIENKVNMLQTIGLVEPRHSSLCWVRVEEGI